MVTNHVEAAALLRALRAESGDNHISTQLQCLRDLPDVNGSN